MIKVVARNNTYTPTPFLNVFTRITDFLNTILQLAEIPLNSGNTYPMNEWPLEKKILKSRKEKLEFYAL